MKMNASQILRVMSTMETFSEQEEVLAHELLLRDERIAELTEALQEAEAYCLGNSHDNPHGLVSRVLKQK